MASKLQGVPKVNLCFQEILAGWRTWRSTGRSSAMRQVLTDGSLWLRRDFHGLASRILVFECNRRQMCWFSEFSGFWSSWRLSLVPPTSILPSSWSSLTQLHWSHLRCNIFWKYLFKLWQIEIWIKMFQDCGGKPVPCYISCTRLVQPEPGQNLNARLLQPNR